MSQVSIGLSLDLDQILHGRNSQKVFDRGSTLFRRGTPVSGIYVVDSGRVRITLPTSQGLPQLLEINGPGTILGLSESVSGEDYRVTAEAEDHVIASFVSREGFMELLRNNCEFSLQVVRLLSEDVHCLYHKFRNINARPGRPRRLHPEERLN